MRYLHRADIVNHAESGKLHDRIIPILASSLALWGPLSPQFFLASLPLAGWQLLDTFELVDGEQKRWEMQGNILKALVAVPLPGTVWSRAESLRMGRTRR